MREEIVKMIGKMKNRILAFIISLIMIVALFAVIPTNVFAVDLQEDVTLEDVIESTYEDMSSPHKRIGIPDDDVELNSRALIEENILTSTLGVCCQGLFFDTEKA